MTDVGAAIRTIEGCMDTHQKWIDWWLRHKDGDCACGLDHETEATLAGNRAHHESINDEYRNVLNVIDWLQGSED